MTALNGHDFGPYRYAGMGNTERVCVRCNYRQDEQLDDTRVPPCRAPQMTTEEAEGMVNVALHPAMFDSFVMWLNSRELDLSPPIPTGEGETFRVVVPRRLNV